MSWDDYIEDEIIDTPETEIVEEDVIVDEKFIKNKELIRVDLNIIQFPIFSKNTQRKVNQIIKYYFNKNRDTYITVSPIAGDYIPGEMEEKVFIALMQIMKERNMPQKFLVSAPELRDKLRLNTNTGYINVVKRSLLRLSETNFKFKNTMYSSELGGVIGKEVSTSILNLEIINLSLAANKQYRAKINDKRIKEIYRISISDHFYQNIIQRGYLVYNSEILLDINSSTARTIYMLVEKIRFRNLYLKLDTMFLIKRIPLKYDKKNIGRTIKTLENAFNELKDKKLISDFSFLKDTTWEKSEIEIAFPESANDEKQDRFYDDRNDFRKIISLNSISETEHEMLEEIGELNEVKSGVTNTAKEVVTEENIDRILGLLPTKARNLKTMPRTIADAIGKYGYEKVKSAAIYTKQQKVDKIRSYFLKTLENNWAEDVEKIKSKPLKLDFEAHATESVVEDVPKYDETLYNEFESFSKTQKEEIEKEAYKEYVHQCGGMNTKIQQTAFKYSKKKYICEYMEKHKIKTPVKVNNDSIVSENSEKDSLTIDEIKDRILKAIEFGNLIYSYTEGEKDKLFREILREMVKLSLNGELTKAKVTEVVNEYIKI